MPILELLVHPVVPYGLLALGLMLCTFLSLTLKQDLQRNHKRHAQTEQGLERLLCDIKSELSSLRCAVEEAERKASVFPQMSEPRASMNVSRRSQVLRMHKRGERPEQIAAALSLPPNEVRLLLKLATAPGEPARREAAAKA